MATAPEVQRAAVALFAERGYNEVSVDDIATELGIGRTTFFRYFGTKSAVVWADFASTLDQLDVALASADSVGPAMRVLRETLLAVVHYAETDQGFMRTRFDLVSQTPELAVGRAHLNDRLARVLADFVRTRGRQPVDPVIPEALGHAIVGVMIVVSRIWADAAPGTSFTDALQSALEAVTAPFELVVG